MTRPRGARPARGVSGRAASPSDVAGGVLGRGRVVIGGRVVDAGPRHAIVADALAAVRVALVEAPYELCPGDLVRVEGTCERSRLVRARVIDRIRGEAPRAHSEFGRFSMDGTGRRLAGRSEALSIVRSYFEQQAFLEVETPVRVSSPGLDAHVDAVRAEGGFLITSPELHMKRLLVGGFPRVYQLARVSRAFERGALHEPEFTMLEWYRAFSGIEAMIADTERIVGQVVARLSPHKKTRKNRVFATAPVERAIDVTAPFRRLTVREAFREHAGVDDAAELARTDPDRYYRVFVEAVEPGLSREPAAVLLWEFPISEAALARPCPHDPTVAERFEVYVGGVELCNGFGELTDAVEQRRRFDEELARRRRTGAPEYPIDDRFLAALEEGMPPSGGNALGFDRLVMLALGAPCVADVTAFPSERA